MSEKKQVNLESLYHSLDISFLTNNFSVLDWDLVSRNIHIIWTKEIIIKFAAQLNWEYLVTNTAIDWKNPEFFVLANDNNKVWLLFNNDEIKFKKSDYFTLKNYSITYYNNQYKDWSFIPRFFINTDLDWSLKEFKAEFGCMRKMNVVLILTKIITVIRVNW